MTTNIPEHYKQLIEAAKSARTVSYAPYSHYHVGAALLTADGRIFTGCNIENGSYGATVCAERTAFFKAISEGVRQGFRAIAIAGGPGEEIAPSYPCGICRQVMSEFCDRDFEIIVVGAEGAELYTLGELLPHSFVI